jgi:predicted glutamine amidotransferase
MCRWMAWYGQPVLMEELLFKPKHGLIDQSRHARMGVETTNGDGFGLGWYGAGEGPGLYHSIAPAWGDENLRELASHIESPLFLAHVRATTGTAIQQTNCHPFRHGDWLFVHNGAIAGMEEMRRDLVLAVDPSLFPSMRGSTDSEVVFHLALTNGLKDDPILGLERAVGLIEETARRHGIADPVQGTFGISDGNRLWAVRYASTGRPRSLFASTDAASIRHLYPDNERFQQLRDEDRIVLSEPLVDLPGLWDEVPGSSALIVQPGPDERRPFRPRVERGTAVPA